MPEIVFDVKIGLVGPVLTQSSGAGALGIDAPMAKNGAGEPYLPGTLIKGKLREAWGEIVAQSDGAFADYRALLGKEGGNRQSAAGVAYDAHRSRLSFSDFVDRSGARKEQRRVRVQMDSARGAVQEHMLAVIESIYQAGEPVTFEGTVRFEAESEAEAAVMEKAIGTGLRWVHSFGAERTVGFGRLREVAVTRRANASAVAAGALAGVGTRMAVVLTTDQPFCVTETRASENLFASGAVIPGAVWKGALAQTWLASLGKSGAVAAGVDPKHSNLAAHFDQVVFSHAVPSKSDGTKQYRVLPLSLVRLGADEARRTMDAALVPEAMLIANEAPAFSIDWKNKDFDKLEQEFVSSEPPKELRVRTAIDGKTRRAKDEALFAYEMVQPSGWEWRAEADVSRVPVGAQGAVLAELGDLLARGIRGLGKTKAAFSVRGGGVDARPKLTGLSARDCVVMLRSHALLADSEAMAMKHGDAALFAEYGKVWSELSDGKLELKHYFAQQFLQGGPYLYDRFQKGGANGYTPYLLTKAGSVFVFSAKDGVETVVERWLGRGLDVPAWAVKRFARGGHDGTHWSNNPYVPQNGYGAVTVNADLHWEKKLHG